ncbi:hypothetical protein, partial [Paraburkholderia dipogonis]|uniref:hypothetical protein n=1 Tax=Paraburkholderia dipogonis TaxID=1211383 RepID=UPI0038B90E4A
SLPGYVANTFTIQQEFRGESSTARERNVANVFAHPSFPEVVVVSIGMALAQRRCLGQHPRQHLAAQNKAMEQRCADMQTNQCESTHVRTPRTSASSLLNVEPGAHVAITK